MGDFSLKMGGSKGRACLAATLPACWVLALLSVC